MQLNLFNMKFLLSLALFISQLTFAQRKKQDISPPIQTAPQTSSGIDAKVAGMKKYPGYFEFYYDEKQDKVFLIIDKLDTEFLYIESLTAAVGSNDIGLDRNQLGRERVVKLE